MVAIELLTFDEAMARVEECHLLLGNGFSRALMDEVFAYDALKQRADFGGLSQQAWQAFDVLGTSDFERVMRAMRNAAALAALYEPGSDLSQTLRADAEGLKEVLVRTIAGSHPEYPGVITQDQYGACRRFLSRFKSIYTVNYDLLLYWALMQKEVEPELECDDGFRKPEDDEEAAYVTWEPDMHSQSVHYLHGALHIFDSGTEIQKYTWINTGIRLIDQIREAMDHGLFPVFVAESDSGSKQERIMHSAFLSRSVRSFRSIGKALCVFGHSFGETDRHITRSIGRSKVRQLLVSLHGDPNSEWNQGLVNRVRAVAEGRRGKALDLLFYDAQSADVWG